MKYLRTNLIGLLCVSVPLGVLTAFLFVSALPGCSTPPTQQQSMATTVIISAAVAMAVQHDSKNPEVWEDRAVKIVDIAQKLQKINDGAIATLPALTAALEPMVMNLYLPPAEQLAATLLISSLSQVIDQQKGKIDDNSQLVIQSVLASVITSATVYIPGTPIPSPSPK